MRRLPTFLSKVKRYVEGKEVQAPPASIKLFSLLEGMKWAHLPVAGGLYDQHPQFVDEISIIFSERAKEQEKKRQQDERKQRASKSGGKGVAGRRR